MLETSQFRRYLLYAFGEVLLVMIGILLALRVNNLNEERKEKVFQNQLIIELKSELDRNIDKVKWAINGNRSNQLSAEIILTHFNESYPSQDSLHKHFARAHAWWQLPIGRSAFNNLEDHGMYFMGEDLRNGINHIYGSGSELIEDLIDRQSTYFYSTVVPFLTDHFDSSSFGGFEEPYEMIPLDYQSLKSSQRFRNILKSNIKNRQREISRMNALVRNMEDILYKLETERIRK